MPTGIFQSESQSSGSFPFRRYERSPLEDIFFDSVSIISQCLLIAVKFKMYCLLVVLALSKRFELKRQQIGLSHLSCMNQSCLLRKNFRRQHQMPSFNMMPLRCHRTFSFTEPCTISFPYVFESERFLLHSIIHSAFRS